jgi:3-phenylpropionate/trans-cinnamate dioxygenase ferredoxin reductase component
MAGSDRVVVVGAGLAGLRTVQGLRARGYAGSIALIGAEQREPYDRPPLSKKVLTEAEPPDPSLRADFAALDVEFRPGEAVTSLDFTLPVVIATGATPIGLPGPGPQRFLRTYDDALALRAVLRPGLRLAIVGAGWIGAELATAAAGHGCKVTVIEAGPAPLAGALTEQIGTLTASWYEHVGVELRTGVAVQSVEAGGLALAGGEWLPADEVVTAIGVRPTVGWLAGSGIGLENGVAVDAGLRASVPGVYAVGDCAAFWSQRFGRRLRFEHWDVALHAPEVVAANVIGDPAGGPGEVYDPVPYFWSEQFGRMLQYAGYHGDATTLVWRGDPASDAKWTACWLSSGRAGEPGEPGDADARLVAVLTVDNPRDLVQGRRVIESGLPVDAGRLADPAVPVKEAVRAS